MAYVRTIIDPISGAYRRFASGFRSDYYPTKLYAILSARDENPDEIPHLIAELGTDGSVTQSATLVYDGAAQTTSLVGPVLRPPTGANLYTARTVTGGAQSSTSTWFTEIKGSDLTFSKKSGTPSDTGKTFATRECIRLAATGSGDFIAGQFSGDATTPIGSFGIWAPSSNTVKYYSSSVDLGFSSTNQPSSPCWDVNGKLWLFVCNSITGGNNDVKLCRYGVNASCVLNLEATFTIATDSTANWTTPGAIYLPASHAMIYGIVKAGSPDQSFGFIRVDLATGTLTATHVTLNEDWFGQSLAGGSLGMGIFPMGASGSWMTSTTLAGVHYTAPYSHFVDGLKRVDLTTGVVTNYALTLWGADGALPNLVAGNALYLPAQNALWIFRLNQFQSQPGSPTDLVYEGLGIYTFDAGGGGGGPPPSPTGRNWVARVGPIYTAG